MPQTIKQLISASLITTFALSASHAWALNTRQAEGTMAGVVAGAVVVPAAAVGISARLNRGDASLDSQIEAAQAAENSTDSLGDMASHGNAATAEIDQLDGATNAATNAVGEATAGSAFDAPSVMTGGADVPDSTIESDILGDGGGDVVESAV